MNCVHCGKASRHIHPDIIIVDKPHDKRDIIVDQIRELKKDVLVLPNEAEKKAYIVNDADLMNIKAQNAFLQILEEPPAHVVFILRTKNPAALLPTVRSRCIEVKAQPEIIVSAKAEETTNPTDAAEMASDFFSALDSGNACIAAFMFRLEKLDKEALEQFLVAARIKVVAKLGAIAPDTPAPVLKKMSHAERVLQRAGEMLDLNVSVGHISGMICASLLAIDF